MYQIITGDVLGVDRKLKEHDPQLYIMYNPHTSKFEIWRHSVNGDHLVLVVQDENGNPMPLDDRVVTKIKMMDGWRSSSVVDDILKQIDKHNQAVEKQKKDEFEEKTEEAAERLEFTLRKEGLI